MSSSNIDDTPERVPLKALIFDLGDVLFTWSASTTTSIPAKTLRSILNTDAWVDFDCGRITQEECYDQAARHVPFSAKEIREAFRQARDSLQPNMEVIEAIRSLKKSSHGQLKIFAMSNISKEDYAYVSAAVDDWQIFDRVFASGHAGMRKPDAAFYRHVLDAVSLSPRDVMFIDDKVENVLAAQNLGIRAVVFSESQVVVDILARIESDPYERGYRYLLSHRDDCRTFTETGVSIDDNFAKLLIQEALPFLDVVQPEWNEKITWNYFIGTPVLVPGAKFPDDLDTTSLALMVVPPESPATATAVLDNILKFVLPDGRFQTYFDWDKPRFDEIVSANILACFYAHGRGHQLPNTLPMLHTFLLDRGYEQGTRYYPDADNCLYFLSRLLKHITSTSTAISPDQPKQSFSRPPTPPSDDAGKDLPTTLTHLLISRVLERVGTPAGGAVQLALRVITCSQWAIPCRKDVAALKALQEEDGGWPGGWMYRYGSTGMRLGNRAVATALACKALDAAI